MSFAQSSTGKCTPAAVTLTAHQSLISAIYRATLQGLFSALGNQATSVIKPAPVLPVGLAETVQVDNQLSTAPPRIFVCATLNSGDRWSVTTLCL